MVGPLLVAAVHEYLGSFDGTGVRIVATAVLSLLAVVLASVVVPRLVAAVVVAVDRRATGRLEVAVERTRERLPWRAPMRLLVRSLQFVVVGLTALAVLVVWGQVGFALELLGWVRLRLPLLARMGTTVALVFGAWLATELLGDAIAETTEGMDRVTAHQEQILYRVLQLTVFTAAGLAVLSLWNVDLGGLLVGAGFLGIVFGLAARQTLGSLVAGIVLMFSRPFQIGDWVVIGDAEGFVTDITVINTRIRSFDGEYVAIPNDKVGDSVVRNRSREGSLRLRTAVGIDYRSDPDHAADVALEAVREVDAVVDNPQPNAVPTGFGDSSVDLELRFWIDRPTPQRKWQAKRGVVAAVKAAFEEEGITIPFPQREVSQRSDPATDPVSGGAVRSFEGDQSAPGGD